MFDLLWLFSSWIVFLLEKKYVWYINDTKWVRNVLIIANNKIDFVKISAVNVKNYSEILQLQKSITSFRTLFFTVLTIDVLKCEYVRFKIAYSFLISFNSVESGVFCC